MNSNYNPTTLNNPIPINSDIVSGSHLIPIQYPYQYQPDPVPPLCRH